MIRELKVSAPGRICLFGEHQDYLNLPVITAAINLRIGIHGKKRNDNLFVFSFPDIQEKDQFEIKYPIPYKKERDYLRSAVNVLQRQGIRIPCGYDCSVHGEIPINSGTSSSSALIVAWIKFLLTISRDKRKEDAIEIARLANQAEVIEFNEPGGMMDHYATSVGGVLFIDFKNHGSVSKLSSNICPFVLGDSLEPKDTKGILERVKGGIFNILKKLSKENSVIDIRNLEFSEVESQMDQFSEDQIQLLRGALKNRNLTLTAYQRFKDSTIDSKTLGEMLSECQTILRNDLKISTPKIDRMIDAGIGAGATGGKINGSGGGGCMFVCAPKNQEKIAAAIENEGGKAHIINIDQGVRLDQVVEEKTK